jgi:DNA-binding IclR family transcriptional regulator
MDTSELLALLNRRRHELGMPIVVISRQSRVHPSTVQRLLAGELSVAGFGIVCRVALALGVHIAVREESVIQMKRQAARAAAAKLVKSIQATSALEAQAVGTRMLKVIEERIMAQLLAGPGYKLWAK